MDTTVDKTNRIRELNDAFRRTFIGGQVVLTSGVDALPADVKAQVLQAVKSFDAFDGGNDPHKDDFGAFEIGDQRYFWKIDYYNRALDGASEDPADPNVTTRVLTIMLAWEY
jgi:Protein of unknown function (DUF3768)